MIKKVEVKNMNVKNINVLFIDSSPMYLLGLPYGFYQLGCKVKTLKDIKKEEIRKVFEQFRPDLVMTAGWTDIHDEDKLEMLARYVKKYDAIHAYWATEDPVWTKQWSFRYIRMAKPDYIFTIDRETVPKYNYRGLKAYYLQWGCNPKFHRPGDQRDEYSCDIAVVASAPFEWNSYRLKSVKTLLKPLVENNYDVVIWGEGWDNINPRIFGFKVKESQLRGKLPYVKTNDVYSSAKIVLGFQNNFYESTQRTYEILGARGFLLAPATNAITELFDHKKHLIISNSEAKTLKLVDYYLKHDDERKKIAAAGQKQVYEKHTYAHRASKILKCILENR